MAEVQIRMTEERLRGASEPIAALMNQLQARGFSPDEVISALLFMCGSSLKQRGVSLNLDAPIGTGLPPLTLGYTFAQPVKETEQQRILRAKGYVC